MNTAVMEFVAVGNVVVAADVAVPLLTVTALPKGVAPFMNCTDPPLTTVRQPIDAMGRAVVTLLANQIDGAEASAEHVKGLRGIGQVIGDDGRHGKRAQPVKPRQILLVAPNRSRHYRPQRIHSLPLRSVPGRLGGERAQLSRYL